MIFYENLSHRSVKNNSTILALYPNQWGIAYALFHSVKDIVDCGVAYVQPACNIRAKKRVQKYLDFYEPDIVLLRDSGEQAGKRMKKLVNKIEDVAKDRGLKIHRFSRTLIREVFSGYNAYTKYEISKVLIKAYPDLKKYAFPERKKWLSENHRAGIFDAVSMGLTYYLRE